MKKFLLILLILLFICSFVFNSNRGIINQKSVNNYNVSSIYTVVIDPGHGGKDNGASALDNTREKDLNLAIALILRDYLSVCGIKVKMTRDGDYELYKQSEKRNRSDLYNRLDYINSIDNAIMVSIHQNFYTNDREWGMQIWYSPNDACSKILADNIQDVNKLLLNNTNNRLNKKSDDDYYILFNATCPSVMIECGFMSNREENEKLKALEYQEKLGYSIMLGINEYIGI